jgi:hypothetical protein
MMDAIEAIIEAIGRTSFAGESICTLAQILRDTGARRTAAI